MFLSLIWLLTFKTNLWGKYMPWPTWRQVTISSLQDWPWFVPYRSEWRHASNLVSKPGSVLRIFLGFLR